MFKEHSFLIVSRISIQLNWLLPIVPRLYGENVPWVEVLNAELPWASQLFLGFLTKLGQPFKWESKIWLSRKGYAPSGVDSVKRRQSPWCISSFGSCLVSYFWFVCFFFLNNARLSWLGRKSNPLSRDNRENYINEFSLSPAPLSKRAWWNKKETYILSGQSWYTCMAL